jgi:hypothetical protein
MSLDSLRGTIMDDSTEGPRTKSEQDSLAPLQLDRASVEEEAASMNRGKGRQLLAIAGIAGLLLIGGAAAMKGLEREQGYSQAGAALGEIKDRHVDAYMACALPGVPALNVASSERLHSSLENFAERFQKDYGLVLRRCEPRLEGLVADLAQAPVPRDMKPALAELQTAASSLYSAAASLRDYLEDPSKAYDYVTVTGHIDRLAKARTRYSERQTEFELILNAKR